ncbi:MAG: hypothetical protein IKE91_09035 [Clostridia bacterium]|nr:hypothetical protein [Clostridia bacterium]
MASIILIGQSCTMAAQQIKDFDTIEQAIDLETTKNTNLKLIPVSAPTINQKIETDSGMNSIISTVAGIAGYLCAAAAVIVLVFKGVQFMNASPEGKAEIKKQMIAIAVGAAIVFSITGILRLISSITDTLF